MSYSSLNIEQSILLASARPLHNAGLEYEIYHQIVMCPNWVTISIWMLLTDGAVSQTSFYSLILFPHFIYPLHFHMLTCPQYVKRFHKFKR